MLIFRSITNAGRVSSPSCGHFWLAAAGRSEEGSDLVARQAATERFHVIPYRQALHFDQVDNQAEGPEPKSRAVAVACDCEAVEASMADRQMRMGIRM